MKKLVLGLVAAALLAPAAALGGGWATVGLSSLPDDDLTAGAVWDVDLTILQHGRTPLVNVQPSVHLYGPDGGVAEFAAKPTGKPGVYHATVRFPSSGTWRYEIDDGFSRVHTYTPVTVGPASTPSSFPTAPLAGLAVALTAAAALALLLVRRRRPAAAEPAALGR